MSLNYIIFAFQPGSSYDDIICYHVQVVAYWTRGQAAVEMKATKYMKKREAQFSPVMSNSIVRKKWNCSCTWFSCPLLVHPSPCQLAFIDLRSIKGASYVDIVKPCCDLVWRSLVGCGWWYQGWNDLIEYIDKYYFDAWFFNKPWTNGGSPYC